MGNTESRWRNLGPCWSVAWDIYVVVPSVSGRVVSPRHIVFLHTTAKQLLSCGSFSSLFLKKLVS